MSTKIGTFREYLSEAKVDKELLEESELLGAGIYRRNEYTSPGSNIKVKKLIFNRIKEILEDEGLSVKPDLDSLENTSASIYLLIGPKDNVKQLEKRIIQVLKTQSGSNLGYLDSKDF